MNGSFTFEEKNTVWDDVASRLSALHGNQGIETMLSKVVQPPEQA